MFLGDKRALLNADQIFSINSLRSAQVVDLLTF